MSVLSLTARQQARWSQAWTENPLCRGGRARGARITASGSCEHGPVCVTGGLAFAYRALRNISRGSRGSLGFDVGRSDHQQTSAANTNQQTSEKRNGSTNQQTSNKRNGNT